MPHRIDGDHKDFKDVYSGRIRKALKKFISNGHIFPRRGKNGKVAITIPKIDIPHIVYGNSGNGISRGPGKPGDVIDKDDPQGKAKGRQAGQEEAEGITINIDLEYILKFLQDELQLPDLKPKPNETFEDVRIKYNDISLTGPESLRHNRRTMLQALKRMSASGEINKLHKIPGFARPVKMITPINSDRRYRQYKEVRIPSSNAVIFFARDGSGSMDQFKCDIVSDMCWWIDVWIRRFYKRVERCYVWHDTIAQEVDENKFYNYRYGGGTTCSSAVKLIKKQLENRFPPNKWNIYIFYFSDGENWSDDNKIFADEIKTNLNSNIVNFIGITQVMAWQYQGSLREYMDTNLVPNVEHVRTTQIAPKDTPSLSNQASNMWYGPAQLSDDERNEQIRKAIIDLMGSKTAKAKAVDTSGII